MKSYMTVLMLYLGMIIWSSPAHADILVFLPNGTYASKPSLSAAVVSHDAVGRKIVITTNVNCNTDITIPDSMSLEIVKGGGITMASGKKLVIQSSFSCGQFKCFDTSATGSNVIFAPGSVSEVYPEWWGAKGDAAVDGSNYYITGKGAIGTDSTDAFKNMMKAVEASSNKYTTWDENSYRSALTIKLTGGAYYKVAGDNPCGIQGTIPSGSSLGLYFRWDGNGATILWEVANITDRCFGKLGRWIKPEMRNLNITPCKIAGGPGTTLRKGSVFSTKTSEGDLRHYWSQGLFENIAIGPNANIIFDIDKDANGTHDDMTLVSSMWASHYHTFIKINNSEAVDWRFERCSFFAQTDNAVHIDIPVAFSGGMTLDSCEILMANKGETFLNYAGTTNAITPIRITGGRMETRNALPMTFIVINSGVVTVEGLQMGAGNSSAIPHTDFRLVKMQGATSFVKFDNCVLFNGIDITVGTASGWNNCLEFNNTSLSYRSDGSPGTVISSGYPYIFWHIGSKLSTYKDVITGGYNIRKIVVNNPILTTGNIGQSHIIASRNTSEIKSVNVFKTNTNGKRSLNFGTVYEFAPYIVITSVKLFLYDIDVTKSNKYNFTVHALPISGIDTKFKTITKTLTTSAPIYGEELLNTNWIISAMSNKVDIGGSFYKDSVQVTDETLMPSGWVQITYHALNTPIDCPDDKLIIDYRLRYGSH